MLLLFSLICNRNDYFQYDVTCNSNILLLMSNGNENFITFGYYMLLAELSSTTT